MAADLSPPPPPQQQHQLQAVEGAIPPLPSPPEQQQQPTAIVVEGVNLQPPVHLVRSSPSIAEPQSPSQQQQQQAAVEGGAPSAPPPPPEQQQLLAVEGAALPSLHLVRSSPSVTEPTPIMPEETPSSPGLGGEQLGRTRSRFNSMVTRFAEAVRSTHQTPFMHLCKRLLAREPPV